MRETSSLNCSVEQPGTESATTAQMAIMAVFSTLIHELRIQNTMASAMITMVAISGRVILPMPETSAMVASMDSCEISSGLKKRVITNHEANSMIMQNGRPIIDHSTKLMFTPNSDENSPTVTTLQPLPVITAQPPA